ncbi:hypothetical protein FSP39_009178 [Pinctada imbricata]|uniref:Haloacid dehalogenase-like hydrolase domain-containing protein 2 n=1 Tax=Pinctada imbricata TaxID=66713 RepID=A0AA88YEE5_PINIB|nr:hypothetical protein FSP39_009178 [Pinctada imbricata]
MTHDKPFSTVLVDLSGTLHIDDTEVPNSISALERLRKTNLNVKFVTNTTKESGRCLLERLNRIGFNIKQSEIFTSLTAASSLICRRQLRPLLLVDNKAKEEFVGIELDNPNAVVIGLAPDKFDFNSMNDAFRLILDGACLLAIHKARYYKKKDSLCLGPGPFVSALEYATDKKAEVVGKPEKSFFLNAVAEFNVEPQECIMIGDDVRDDIGGAQASGMMGILVQTGKYRPADEEKIDPRPFKVVSDFSQAVDFIISVIK